MALPSLDGLMPGGREEDSDLPVYSGRDLGRVGWVDLAPAAGPLPQPCSRIPHSPSSSWAVFPWKREASCVSIWATLWAWSLGLSSPKLGVGTGWLPSS